MTAPALTESKIGGSFLDFFTGYVNSINMIRRSLNYCCVTDVGFVDNVNRVSEFNAFTCKISGNKHNFIVSRSLITIFILY